MKISEAKKELLMHPYFPENVIITPGLSSQATKETLNNRRQPRQDTKETIEVDIEGDEIMGDNTAEEQSRPLHTNTIAFNFNPNSSGIKASIYNFRAQDVLKTPSITIFKDRVKASSPIQQSIQTAMAVPKSIQYSQTRKRKTITVSADTTTLGTTCTPLGDVISNRRATTLTIDITSAVGNDTEYRDVEMTQGEPKRVCTNKTAAPQREESPDILQLCETAIETTEDSVIIVAESTMDNSLEIGKATNENQLSEAFSSLQSSQERLKTRRHSTRRNEPLNSHK
jgi:hypothetical protein